MARTTPTTVATMALAKYHQCGWRSSTSFSFSRNNSSEYATARGYAS